VTKPRRDPAELAALVEQRVSQGLDLVDSFLAATGRGPHRSTKMLAEEHRRALATQRRTVARHRTRRAVLRSQSVGGGIVAGITGSIGIMDAVATAAGSFVPGPVWMWLGAAGVSAVVSVRSRRRLRRLGPDPDVPLLVGPPPTLRRGAIGATEVARFSAVRVQVMTLVPSVERLYPGAGGELQRADAEAATPLTALCERLRVLDDLQRELPGSSAAAAAVTSAEVVRTRLAEGCATYDDLLAAAAALLASPDLDRRTSDILAPAVAAMLAYAHGLQRASDI
jgi:hypothetical protein